ncbi:enoyl-CoA hydratase/isomerase family protein [Planosporangium flavigriseum]|uniref:Enoyl-CoA hydratase n=1 Tax=Planosporangium flavigriseum TaxID=373681 RepID=A0A8J3PKC3_9ACTN|nr:enoyl-CoA hydratase/isomerase family protein [Planosporangium flavigriseum]NJC65132.1 enoyl-CoA hydratase/isomerase family protein [Planosporangium flavigriseum]GIG71748.1 enoyl-CoA hydratase [Planosporangium flavigriseum]
MLTDGRTEVESGVEGLRLAVGDDGVAVLLIDRPAKRNAVTLAMWQALPGLLAALAADQRVRVLLLAGAGEAFSAGADIAELLHVYGDPERADAYHATNVAAEEALAAFPRPTIAVIAGPCVGGGCQLAIACDLRLAESGARLGITPAKLGVVYPAVPTARLVRLVGPARAKYLLFSADLVEAERAAALGLVDEVVPSGGLADRALALARTIAGRSPQTLGAVKDVVNAVLAGNDPQIAVEPWERKSRYAPDVPEGLAAFVERRPPRF